MDVYTVRYFIDTCFKAKSITGLMDVLPPGIKPRHIRIIAVIKELSDVQEYVTVGNVSDALEITSPSVIKSINELHDMGVVIKEGIPEDKRVTKLTLTDTGELYYRQYIKDYHSRLQRLLTDISEKDMQTTINVINRAYSLMKGERAHTK